MIKCSRRCRIVGGIRVGRTREVEPIVRVNQFLGDFWMSRGSALYNNILYNGEFEPEQVKACLPYLDKNRDAIDVGANIGFYTVLFAKVLGDTQRVLSIEPTDAMLVKLKHNIQLNGLSDRVILFEGVAMDHRGNCDVHIVPGREEYSSMGKMDHPSIAGTRYDTVCVPAETVDALVSKHKLDPGFVKIDVEGMELTVLQGMTKTLAKYHPVIMSELWPNEWMKPNGICREDTVEFIQGFGYRVEPIGDYDILCIPTQP